MECAFWHVLSSREEVGYDGDGVGCRCQDDEGAGEGGECGFASEGNGAETEGDDGA